MGVSAMTLGSRELNLWNTTKEMMTTAKVPVVCSNVSLMEGTNLSPIGSTTKVVECNGVKVGLFALMGGDEYAAARPPDGVQFRFDDPFQRAAELVPDLSKQCDVVVLMSEMSSSDTDRLISTVPGIDVAVYGNRASWVEDAVKNGETIVNQTGIRGQYLGELILIVDPAGQIVEFGSTNAALDKVYPEDPEVTKRVTDADAEVKRIQTEAREKSQTEFENKITGERYLGSENCKRCHEAEYQQWASTPHAHAFATLEKDHSHEKAECVSCHVTGYGEASGFASVNGSPDLRNVGCESCHALGTEHDRTRKTEVVEATCKRCHTGDFAKDFDFATFLPKVKHH